MSFIGIIAEPRDEMKIKKILSKRLNSPNREYTIIAINDKSIENVKNIRFETILVLTLDKVLGKEKILNELFKNCKYLAINADMENGLKFINDMELRIITFGFNTKSTITASSVEENFLVCLQRNFIDINDKVLEPQEIEVIIDEEKLSKSSHNILGIASILLIYGKILKKI